MTHVVDASALVLAATSRRAPARELRRRLAVEDTHAPHLVDAEYGNVLRRMVGRKELDAKLARRLLESVPGFVNYRHGHRGRLALAAWAQRDNLTFYDALYAALAAALDVPLVTADERLASAPTLPCHIDVVPGEECGGV